MESINGVQWPKLPILPSATTANSSHLWDANHSPPFPPLRATFDVTMFTVTEYDISSCPLPILHPPPHLSPPQPILAAPHSPSPSRPSLLPLLMTILHL